MQKEEISNLSENRYNDATTTTSTNGSSYYLLSSYPVLDTGLIFTSTLPGG